MQLERIATQFFYVDKECVFVKSNHRLFLHQRLKRRKRPLKTKDIFKSLWFVREPLLPDWSRVSTEQFFWPGHQRKPGHIRTRQSAWICTFWHLSDWPGMLNAGVLSGLPCTKSLCLCLTATILCIKKLNQAWAYWIWLYLSLQVILKTALWLQTRKWMQAYKRYMRCLQDENKN